MKSIITEHTLENGKVIKIGDIYNIHSSWLEQGIVDGVIEVLNIVTRDSPDAVDLVKEFIPIFLDCILDSEDTPELRDKLENGIYIRYGYVYDMDEPIQYMDLDRFIRQTTSIEDSLIEQ